MLREFLFPFPFIGWLGWGGRGWVVVTACGWDRKG
jgi:hypothetical protein